MRIAAIDIGTNSTRLLVANYNGNQVIPLYTDLEATRIGEGVGGSGIINRCALTRTLKCLERYINKCLQFNVEKVRLVATSAVRDAQNKLEVADEVYQKTKFQLEVLTGEKEAELSYLGVVSDLEQAELKKYIVVDLGGGSTELIFPTPKGIEYRSVNLGAVRLYENKKLIADTSTILANLIPEWFSVNPILVGVGGTVTTLVAIKLGLEKYDPAQVHGYQLELEDIRSISNKLNRLSLEQRKTVKGLQPERADIIPYGIYILEKVMEILGVKKITASEKDILYGIIITA
ncbi:MAG: hypothetical protein JM58_08080 [Peptococcaceae bacterium BICA1-8]|nr:MAG: hypothetical protein JM58_08080 [Peptococcaceae bacterium BICA1-8]